MNLFEYDREIQKCVNEDGEVDFEKMEQLTADQENAMENIGKWCLDIKSDIAKIEIEQNRIARYKKQLVRQHESLKRYLAEALNGKSRKFSTFQICCRKTESVEVDEAYLSEIPEEYIVTTFEEKPDKKAIKQALKSGIEIPGAKIVEKISASIK